MLHSDFLKYFFESRGLVVIDLLNFIYLYYSRKVAKIESTQAINYAKGIDLTFRLTGY